MNAKRAIGGGEVKAGSFQGCVGGLAREASQRGGEAMQIFRFAEHQDHRVEVTGEEADAEHPFRMVAAPARSFLNTTFTETPGSQARESRPSVMVHPQDANRLSIAEGEHAWMFWRWPWAVRWNRIFKIVR